jgi:hypothetical protein
MKRWNVWAALRRPKDMKGNSNRPNGVVIAVFFSGGESVTWVAVPGDTAEITGAVARVPGAGMRAVPFSGECCHL